MSPSPEEILARLTKRVKMMTTDDLMSWAETAAMGMGRHIDDFRRNPVMDHLAEIRLAAVSMDAVVGELADRLPE